MGHGGVPCHYHLVYQVYVYGMLLCDAGKEVVNVVYNQPLKFIEAVHLCRIYDP